MNKFSIVIQPIAEWAAEHSELILTTGSIGFSLAAIATTAKNARDIFDTIEDTKESVSGEEDPSIRKQIYVDTLKRLSVKIVPIVALEGMSIYCIIKNNKIQDQKLLEATNALTLANTAIANYRQFEKEATEKLGEEKSAELRQEIAKKRVEENPPKENVLTTSDPNAPATNNDFLYHDVWGNRYFHSRKSPNQIESEMLSLSKDLADGNCDYDEITVNDIYNIIGDSLEVKGGESFGFKAEDLRGGNVSDLVAISIVPGEMPDHETLCYELDILARPLFRTRY